MKKFSFVILALLLLPLAQTHAQVNSATILNLVNSERRAAGLNEVTLNAKLTEAAQMKANDMAAKGYFEHIGPDGKDPWSWYAAVGYDWSWAGEILALNTNTESNEEIVRSWMNSPGHKAIIMDGSYTETGIGIAIGTYQGQRAVFVAEEFGVPKASAKPAPVTALVSVPIPAPIQKVTSVEPIKVVAKKVVAKIVPKVEAKVIAQTTSSSTLESTSTPVSAFVKLSWFARLKIWLKTRLFDTAMAWGV